MQFLLPEVIKYSHGPTSTTLKESEHSPDEDGLPGPVVTLHQFINNHLEVDRHKHIDNSHTLYNNWV